MHYGLPQCALGQYNHSWVSLAISFSKPSESARFPFWSPNYYSPSSQTWVGAELQGTPDDPDLSVPWIRVDPRLYSMGVSGLDKCRITLSLPPSLPIPSTQLSRHYSRPPTSVKPGQQVMPSGEEPTPTSTLLQGHFLNPPTGLPMGKYVLP